MRDKKTLAIELATHFGGDPVVVPVGEKNGWGWADTVLDARMNGIAGNPYETVAYDYIRGEWPDACMAMESAWTLPESDERRQQAIANLTALLDQFSHALNMNEKTQTEILADFCENHAGERYDAINLDAADADWENHYPVVGADGLLTGQVHEAGDSGDYVIVNDLAVIDITDLPESAQQEISDSKRDGTWDGYCPIEI